MPSVCSSPTAHGRSPPPAENPIGSEPAILNLINASKFRPVLQSLIGDFDEPTATQVAVTPPGTDYISGKEDGAEGFNGCGYREEGFPYYNAIVHMDGLSVSDSPQHVCTGTKEQIYLDYIVSTRAERQPLCRQHLTRSCCARAAITPRRRARAACAAATR